MKQLSRVGFAALGLILIATGGVRAFADGSTGARSTDAVAKERANEFHEIANKKRTYQGQDRQLEILKGLEFAPCPTAQRFLFDLFKRKSTSGDHRLYALRSLLRMADEKTFKKIVATLSKAKDPTLWQAFSEELLVRPSNAISEWASGPALKSKDPYAICAFLAARMRKPDPKLDKRIAAVFAKHAGGEKGSVDIAFHALKVLVRSKSDAAREALAEAAKHQDWRLRLAAADTLPGTEPFGDDIEAAVRTLIQDDSPYVQRAAIVAAGKARRTSLADLLISKLGDNAARTRHVAAKALQTLSGQKLGHDAQAWAKWLAKEDPGKPVELEHPKYHGIAIHSDHVVFLVDASSSMAWPWRKETHRIDIALAELRRTLGKLDPKTQFNVIVFSENHTAWKKTSVAATPGNTKAAGKWAAKTMASPEGDTFLYEALASALERHPECDTIFLLTDGNPTAGKYWTADGLVASVRAWTRYRRTAINAVGLSLLNMDRGMPNLSEKPQVMKRVMSGIASATGGEFRDILDEPR